ncbi:GNAT family N-acetyltransferase [Robertkochia solimangrovi]|uniref:GNAT family N-acetyltransferase n=1 Tax=Robertkochia solimangrovi TaxID=2213046 RepID=UPI00117EE2B9|nr:GNAT family N-acetyltransferase [Robertkochia solimangrovi]TRZ41065.1 GNAT family N-acetyltransferase [Robertkochia solimangrovi]
MSSVKIREIQQSDNQEVAVMIRKVLIEMDVPKVGTAYADKALDRMYETYDADKAVYFILEEDGRILGGAGIAQLQNFDGPICELQKMYFLPEARGRGLGRAMMDTCLEKAAAFGFEQVYIETMPNMDHAQKLYIKSGFRYIDAPMGNTGHSSCPVWLIKDL